MSLGLGKCEDKKLTVTAIVWETINIPGCGPCTSWSKSAQEPWLEGRRAWLSAITYMMH